MDHEHASIKVGDFVRIAAQPPNQGHDLKGLIVQVDTVMGNWADVTQVRVDGTTKGGGWVPLGCLEALSEVEAAEWESVGTRRGVVLATRLYERGRALERRR